ncbi:MULTISPECIES: DUF6221 family protein [Streptomyces]|nr:DUF6221 family protein [Streptomyces venezuelae]APE21429.1 hypothetical protein vnz_10595 [Streptomyces venezuelae]QER98816.1 hypothetical protein DEJ43_10740 [Streptomyces venezuelae ATCC 10712]
MEDLIAFLRARLDEDEELALQAQQLGGAPSWDSAADVLLLPGLKTRRRLAEQGVPDALQDAVEAHAARHDPARVLADVDAKRRIVTAYEEAATEFQDIGPGMVSYDRMVGSVSSLRTAIECLSLAYADHPDYQDMWRP